MDFQTIILKLQKFWGENYFEAAKILGRTEMYFNAAL